VRTLVFLGGVAFAFVTAMAGQLSAQATKPAAANCYKPSVHRPTKTPMAALPPPGVCLGQQVKQGGVTYCSSCGGSTQIAGGSGCVSCKAGYTWREGSKSCCKGGIAPKLPPPK
jgi:hypothetical protein